MTGSGARALAARIEAAIGARERLGTRPLRDRAAALAAAACTWRDDPTLLADLPDVAGLSPPMIRTVARAAAEALTSDALAELVERELGTGAFDRPPPPGPGLVAHVLASNVPALALPAFALGCLVGAAVLVRSGRDDPLSAPAFTRALAEVDPELAATLVTADWPRDARDHEARALGRADVVVLTGGDAMLADLGRRMRGRVIAHGPRVSVAAVARDALADAEHVAAAIAHDAALHDQRGCLSPHAVLVETDGTISMAAFAELLVAALRTEARRLPPGPGRLEERAGGRIAHANAEWEPGATVLGTPGAAVVVDPGETLRPPVGGRTLRVHPLAAIHALPARLPDGDVECVGLAGGAPERLAPALRTRGVARLCRVGRMQLPSIAWPRGQRLPLRSLLGDESRELLVERG